MALMKLGAVPVPLNIRLSGKELQYIVEHSDARAIILSPEFEKVIRGIKDDLPENTRYFFSGEKAPEDMIDFEAICADGSDEDPRVAIVEDDIACILYTAGTTGRPKGVLLSHRNCVWASVNIAVDVDLQPEYRVLLVFPLYHAAAFMIVVSNLFVSATNVTIRVFDPKRAMELIAEKKINRMTVPPTVWNFILQLPDLDRYDTSTVRSLSSGAEAIPLETKRRLLGLFPNAGLGGDLRYDRVGRYHHHPEASVRADEDGLGGKSVHERGGPSRG